MQKFWIELRSSLWFVPALLVLTAILLALGLIEVDVRFADQLKPWGWLPFLNAGAEGARGMLTAIASSMITIAGVAFSITIVALSLASTQYTPRILRNFMRDRANQSVLGVFVGIYAYCLLVLRTIRGGAEGGGFVPLISVFVGVLLALLGIGYLIFFLHHIASSIQASSILAAISAETLSALERRFPEESADPIPTDSPGLAEDVEKWLPVPATASGYLQSVNWQALCDVASAADITFEIEHHAGDFVVVGSPLVKCARGLDGDTVAAIRGHFAIGHFRTMDQDPSFGIRQIVDIALKALSPGINDTNTAVACLDYLSVILCRLAPRRMDHPHPSEDGRQRLLVVPPRFADYVAKSLDEIRLTAAANVPIILHMLRLIERVAHAAVSPVQRAALCRHAGLIANTAERTTWFPYDREKIDMALAIARHALGERTPPATIDLNSDGLAGRKGA